jgi:hypothetical protein
MEQQHMASDSPSGKLFFLICPCEAKKMTQEIKSAAAVVSNFVQTEHVAIYDAGPELPKFKLSESKPDPVEKILNMDEDTFRRLFYREADLQMNEVD